MIRFWNKTIKVNEMAGKYYAEIKNKVFDNTHNSDPVVDTAIVKVFDSEDDVSNFINSEMGG